MKVLSKCVFIVSCVLGLIAASPPITAEERIEGRLAERIGAASRSLDAETLIKIHEETTGKEHHQELTNCILPASLVIATAEGQKEITQRIRELLSGSEEGSAIAARLEPPLAQLSPMPVDLDPAEVTPEILLIAKETRKALLVAALAGQSDLIERQYKTIEASDLPAAIERELLKLADMGKMIASEFSGTPLGDAIAQATERAQQQEKQEDREYELLGAYRADPDERPRGADADRWALMQTIETQRADVMKARTEMFTALMDGQLKQADFWKKMQEIASTALDLKEKRAHLYWALKSLRAKNLQDQRAKSVSRNQAVTEELKKRKAHDLSPVWPSLFRHRDLRQHAESLRGHLADYSPTNSGTLSVCYARCIADIRSLHRLLTSNLNGMTIEQRAALRNYLRELEEELEQPYISEGYIAALNRSPETSDDDKVLVASRPSTNVKPIALHLTGNDIEIASYALYRSLLSEIVRAKADKSKLTKIAQLIQDSNLLTPQHRRSLKAVGSSAFTGEITDRELALLEDPGEVLAQLTGAVGAETGADLDLPESYRDEALNVLQNAVLEDS